MSEDSKGRIVIVGGDAAGMSAASVARRIAPKLEIAVLEAGQHISFAACGMPLLFSGELEEPSRLVAVTPEAARSERRLDLRLGHRVRRIDLQGRRVLGERVDGSEAFELGFDRLIIATGARPLVPPVPGVDRPGVFALRHLDHGVALERYLRQERPGRAVVAGAGYVGLDLAEALRKRGLSVTLLARGDGPLLGLEPELSAMVEEALARAGAVLLRGAPLYDVRGGSARGAGVVGGGGGVGGSGGSAGGGAFGVGVGGGDPGRISGVHAGGEELPAELLVLALGVRPASGLGEQAGLALGPQGAVLVDEQTRTSAGEVFAAGDCATQRHLVTGQQVFISQALAANRQGRVAGACAALELLGRGKEAPRDPGTLGTAVKKVFDLEVGRTGLSLGEARRAGLQAFVTVISSRNRAAYYPGSGPLKVALVAERGTGRLLGGQVAGAQGAAKRVDVLATALSAGLDLERLAALDLGYAPVFSPLWDPLLVAARQAMKGA